jgi:riboflavin kinase / FMN hydrolase
VGYFPSVGVQGAMGSGAKVVAVPSLQSQRQHYSLADTVLYSLLDFYPEHWGLPPFEDRNSLHRPLILSIVI